MAGSHRNRVSFASEDDSVEDGSSLGVDSDEMEEDGEAELWAYRRHRERRDFNDPQGLGIEPLRVTQQREQREQERREQREQDELRERRDQREQQEQRERREQRDRREQREQHEQRHFPGDGFDYRRPMRVMNARAEDVGARAPDRSTETVDLTEDDNTVHARALESNGQAMPTNAANPASGGRTSRAQRLPRYGRNIIDIASSDEENQPLRQAAQRRDRASPVEPGSFWPAFHHTTANLRRPPGFVRQPSPARELDDVEFVGSRPLYNRPSRRATPAIAEPPPYPPGQRVLAANGTIDLTADDEDDDVILTAARNARDGINADRPAVAGTGVGTRQEPDYGGGGVARFRNMVQGRGVPEAFLDNYLGEQRNIEAARNRFDQLRERRHELQARVRRQNRELAAQQGRAIAVLGGMFGGVPDAFNGMPMMMDYGTAGFDMGLGARPPTPPYEPPPAVSNGFTRSPEEEEVVVCPNCGDELALGKNEEKQQLWVIKQCGHAYCGACVSNRTRASNRLNNRSGKSKGKARVIDDPPTLPFAKCVVYGCGNHKKLSKPDFIHVWINS